MTAPQNHMRMHQVASAAHSHTCLASDMQGVVGGVVGVVAAPVAGAREGGVSGFAKGLVAGGRRSKHCHALVIM